MRKSLFLFLLSCLFVAARGQTLAVLESLDLPHPTNAQSIRYWFDEDASGLQILSQLEDSYILDVSSLIEGLHTLHYQIVDDENAVSSSYSSIFMKVKVVREDSSRKLRYWFDESKADGQIVSCANGISIIEVSNLSDGFHTIHYQIESNGEAGYIASGLFLKSEGSEIPQKANFWFDNETTVRNVNLQAGIQMIDASSLPDGLHSIHYQVKNNDGSMTPVTSAIFLRMSIENFETVAQNLRYWFDDENTATDIQINEGVQLIDVAALSEGIHLLHYQLKGNDGILCSPVSSLFYKSNITTTETKSIRYWFDDDISVPKQMDVVNGARTIDVTGLRKGLHAIYCQPIDGQGNALLPTAKLFVHDYENILVEGESNRIVKYQYWMNDNSETIEKVMLDKVSNPYQLLGLLPMQKEPIRSSCFQFEFTNGVPMLYAKNVFNIRFFDAQNYYVEDSRPFVDYSVRQNLTDAEVLVSDVRATTPKPSQNDIKWYSLQAEPGDSLQFKLDRAATLQLFSPSAKEVYTVSGAESVELGGLHVFESGTYYLALHDVTATQGNTISIDYTHIDKYAVLRQDVTTVGNGGCSTITFDGNGFSNLYAVDLVKGSTTLNHAYLDYISNAQTALTFDFSDVALGDYKAIFHFTDEDRTVEKCIKVEEAKDITLDLDVSYPATFLRGTSTTYTVKITNNGNMTAYHTPVYIYIASKGDDSIFKMTVDGLDLVKLRELLKVDTLSTEIQECIHRLEVELDDKHYFTNAKVYDDQLQDSVLVHSGYFFVDLNPSSTKKIVFTFETNEIVDVWVTVPDVYYPITVTKVINNSQNRLHRRINREEYCCIKEEVECVAKIVADASSIVNTILTFCPKTPYTMALSVADCVISSLNEVITAAGTLLCGEDENDTEKSFWEKVRRKTSVSPIWTIISCVTSIIDDKSWIKEILEGITTVQGAFTTLGGLGADVADCKKAWTEKKPNCPPKHKNGGGSSTPVAPSDPNEIYGYLAPSGSNAVKKGLRDVYYTIQFENDPEFATASAHEVFVRDTLDSKRFDLKTFAPTSIRIGDKTVQLDGQPNFVKTIDMRPNIYAIAQVECQYNQQKGIAEWHFSSLDPMTMEPTDDVMQGFLPVNANGNGIGEVSFDIKLKSGLADGAQVTNRAGIVFDQNEVIMTPVWENIIDLYAPESHVTEIIIDTDATALVNMEATDNLSGVWKYDVYVQYGEGASWWKEASDVPADQMAKVRYYEDIVTNYLTVAYDMAGNMEFRRELNPDMGDATGIKDNRRVTTADGRYYDLQGRRLGKKPQRGAYIKDRKKHVAK